MRQDQFLQYLATTTDAATTDATAVAGPFVAYPQLKSERGIKYTRVHLRRLIARGQFPRPFLLSPNRIAWRLSDIVKWEASRPMAPKPTETA
jgi:predicted DNA-binding transcriptional regulator AlpA